MGWRDEQRLEGARELAKQLSGEEYTRGGIAAVQRPWGQNMSAEAGEQ